ncbi:MAG: asparagine synthase C-terminal domain-containing protein, partial [Pirellulales bacterium]|nr:asparagine synthase C-terminal domain-containing protein [Pirellulales bacterium]
RHHLVTCSHADIGEVFPDMVWHAEVPLTRTSPAPLFLLSRLVREHGLKVVLTGEGADEILGGYNIFKEAKIRRYWARRPESEVRPRLLGELYRYIGNMPGDAFLRKFFGQGLSETGDPRYSHALRWRNTARAARFFSQAFRDEISAVRGQSQTAGEEVELPPGFMDWSPLARAQFIEATLFLPEYLLSSQGDRMGMANSVEGRFPFLDHNVVEFCAELAPRLKLNGLNEKFILKKAVADLLPESIWRRSKQPYRAPIHASFFPDGKLLDWVADVLSPASIASAGFFDPRSVAGLVQKVTRGGSLGETDNMALAGVLSTQLINQRFVEDFRPSKPLDECDDVKVVARGYDCLSRAVEE